MAGFSNLMPPNVMVKRDNDNWISLPPVQLVPGDIVQLNMGMAIPADMRIIECSSDMQVDNSSLTGETEPQKRDWKKTDHVPAEAANLIFFGTLLVNGKGTGLVINTGDDTFMGRTAKLASSTASEETPIAKEMNDFVIKLFGITGVLCVIFFIIGYVNNHDVIRNLIFLIGLITANVPEGLLATVTASLTLTARRMFLKNVRVKKFLQSVETLGSTSVICSDKTGTLTCNVMTVMHLNYDLKICKCDTMDPYQSIKGDFYNDKEQRDEDFLRLLRCGVLCNNAQLVDGRVDPKANATEAAILKFTYGHVNAQYKMNINDYRNQHKKNT